MKRLILFFMVFVFVKTQAQTYQLSFTGTGASTIVDSVKVDNLTQGTSMSLNGSDTLNLMVSYGINNTEFSTSGSVSISPNPMTGSCLIGFDAPASGEATLQLYNAAGNRISYIHNKLTKGHQIFSLSGLGCGIYFIRVESDRYSFTSRIISVNVNSRSHAVEIKYIDTDLRTALPSLNSTAEDPNPITEKSLKRQKSLRYMSFNVGDRMMITGFAAGIYRNVLVLVPTQNQTNNFQFSTCTDAGNHNYSTVQIGSQVWMGENLNVGTRINGVKNQINNDTIEKYCYNDDENNCNVYGGIYLWDEMMQYSTVEGSQGICPTGWHLPSDSEWTVLTNYLGGNYCY